MSRRTAASDKAIRVAWEKERELVSKGKGTRDWTPEQQAAILDPEQGRALDEYGKALQGHHMKSVSKYPDDQGNPANIQFLTREEHWDAHKGNWLTPTNGYYDPVIKQFLDFGEGDIIPCKAIDLSIPIVSVNSSDPDTVSDEVDQAEKDLISCTDPSLENNSPPIETDSSTGTVETIPPDNQKSKKNIFDNIQGIATRAKVFSENHPIITGVLKAGLGLAAVYGTSKAIGSLSKTSSSVGSENSVISSQTIETVGKVITEAAAPIFKNSESILKKYGYAVAKDIGLTDTDRQNALRNIISNGILPKEAVCKCIENFINLHKNQSNFSEAVSKWKLDLAFIRDSL